MLGIIKAEKVGMTTFFDEAGEAVPITLVRPLKMVVTQIKTPEKDGKCSIQLAYKETTEKHVNKPKLGILKKAGVKGYYRKFFEARIKPEEIGEYKLGQVIDPSEFLDYWAEVDVWGISKGRGFAGVMKRHGFKGQERTHGEPDERRPMSSGATDAARVFPGTKKPGHMGARRVTVFDLSCVEYNAELNILAIQGSIPGPNGGEVTLKLRKLLTEDEVKIIRSERGRRLEESVTGEKAITQEKTEDAISAEAEVQEEERAGRSAEPSSAEAESQDVSAGTNESKEEQEG